IDLIVFATGYHVSLPLFEASKLVTFFEHTNAYGRKEYFPDLVEGVCSDKFPNLYVFGIGQPRGGVGVLTIPAAQFIVRMLWLQCYFRTPVGQILRLFGKKYLTNYYMDPVQIFNNLLASIKYYQLILRIATLVGYKSLKSFDFHRVAIKLCNNTLLIFCNKHKKKTRNRTKIQDYFTTSFLNINERLREQKLVVKRSIRELDRELRRLEKESEKIEEQIKKQSQDEQSRILGHFTSNTTERRDKHKKLVKLKTELRSLLNEMNSGIALTQLHKSIGSVSKAMLIASDQIALPQLQVSLAIFVFIY
ncbi:monooxygenase flavin binding family protein, partial [Reticulomyxa filosa]